MTSYLYQQAEKAAQQAREVVEIALNPPVEEGVTYKRMLDVRVRFGYERRFRMKGDEHDTRETFSSAHLNTWIENYLQDRIEEVVRAAVAGMDEKASMLMRETADQLEAELARVRALIKEREDGTEIQTG